MNTDHCVYVQQMYSWGHHRNGFQRATCIFRQGAGVYYSVTLSAINMQLHNPLLSLHSTILIIYLCISFFSSVVTQILEDNLSTTASSDQMVQIFSILLLSSFCSLQTYLYHPSLPPFLILHCILKAILPNSCSV